MPLQNWVHPDIEAMGEAERGGLAAPLSVDQSSAVFFGVNPCRLVDTRPNTSSAIPGVAIGEFPVGGVRDYLLTGRCGIPADATSVSLNITAVTTSSGSSFLSVGPFGSFSVPPSFSTLNWVASNLVVANAAIVPLDQGKISVFAQNKTQVIIDTNGYFASTAQIVPVGTILEYGASTAPPGWLVCDGAEYPRTTYPALFAAIGTSFGASTNSTFRVPDIRGRFTRMMDGAAGNDPDKASRTQSAPGGASGNNIGSLQGDMFASHSHNFYSPSPLPLGNAGTNFDFINQVTGLTRATSVAGGNETRPRNIYLNRIIKY